MKIKSLTLPCLKRTGFLLLFLAMTVCAQAAVLVNFPFNEGSGTTTADTASGLTGLFGAQQDPAVDFVTLTTNSPSGLAGDGSITTSGAGFLLVNDSTGPVLNFTNGPITLESWVFLPPVGNANVAVVSYGNSYRMGIRGSRQVFSLIGRAEITNSAAGFLPDSVWLHLAAAWEPGVGVHFYINGTEYFEPNTNTVAASPSHNYLSIAGDGFVGGFSGSLDRVRIHNALLSSTQIDSDAANPKAPLVSTKVAYNFNEVSFPANSSVAPSRPTIASAVALPPLSSPVWTNDSPAGVSGDSSLAFLSETLPIKQVVTVNGLTNTDLIANNTNYTLEAWVKLPARLVPERAVIFRTEGPAPRISLSINGDRTLHTSLLGNTDFISTVHVPNDGRWHHVAAVMESFARVRFYLDGILRQTVNRTAAGALTPGTGNSRLLMGKENETRYFKGLIDRIRISNTALTNSTLDFPAVAGLPIITAQPADAIVSVGSNATFSATVSSGTAVTYQWRYRSNLLDLTGAAIASATNTTLTVSNLSPANQGFYFVVTSNSVGVSESYGARLTVRTQPGALAQLWRIAPGTAAATNPSNVAIITGASELERSIGYNPTTDHLLLPARSVSQGSIKGIFILRASDGAYLGELPNPGIVSGGTIFLTRIAVADDGAIFVCNFGTLSDAVPLMIYRWGAEDAQPTIAYQGNPPSGIIANQQYGKNMIVRGSGTNTQILLDSRTSVLTLLTTPNGIDFTPTLLQEDGFDGGFLGMAWGEGDTFWGKQFGEPLYQWALNRTNQFAPVIRTYNNFPGESFTSFSFNSNRTLIGGINFIAPPPYSVQVWDIADLNRDLILLDTATFSTSAAHIFNYGNVLFGSSNRVFALIPNNGITVYTFTPAVAAPQLGIRRSGNSLIVFWPSSFTNYILESSAVVPFASPVTVPYVVVGNENQATIQPGSGNQFYRLRK